MQMILADQSRRNAKVKEKLDFLNEQYEFNNEIPKGVAIVKIDEEISDQRYEEIMFGIG